MTFKHKKSQKALILKKFTQNRLKLLTFIKKSKQLQSHKIFNKFQRSKLMTFLKKKFKSYWPKKRKEKRENEMNNVFLKNLLLILILLFLSFILNLFL